MEFRYLADHTEYIPTIAERYFRQWGDRSEAENPKELQQVLHAYTNRRKIPLMLLAMEQDNLLGVVQLKYREMDIYPEKLHWLGGIYVLPEMRGRGIAMKLVGHAEEIARAMKINTLYLQTERLDGGLYATLGWQPVEQVRYKGYDVLVMKKELV
ncbi:MAG: GNAT family N-acetyltransferase [Balneolaceae bacterium]|nr:GNAT family N-acetyltransferase [Balneolaceae bacterium]